MCDQVATLYSKEILKGYRIRISSTEIVDAILDEARVSLENRLSVLKILSTLETKTWNEVKKELSSKNLVEASHLPRVLEIMQIRGTVDQVEAQTRSIKKHLGREDRFQKVIERFKSIRNYLKYFGVQEEDPSG